MSSRCTRILLVLGLAAPWELLANFGCRSSDPATTPAAPVANITHEAAGATIVGSGATLPNILYQRWTEDYKTASAGHSLIRYEPTGSAAGVQSFLTGKTDFGATDNALSKDELAFANGDTLEIPATGALVVVAFNIPGVPALQLPRATVAKLFSGQITRWNDPEIVAANPEAALPDLRVITVHRLDGSGTTHLFTTYLASDAAWPKKLGAGKSISWPSGLGTFGNEAMGVKIKHNEGAVGYVGYGVAKQIKLAMAALQAGASFVEPGVQSGRAALEELSTGAPATRASYPLVTLSWLLVHKHFADPKRAQEVLGFMRYALTQGQASAESLGYVPLPGNLAMHGLAAVESIAQANR